MMDFQPKRFPIEKFLAMGNSTSTKFAEIMAKKGVMTMPSNKKIQHFIETHNLTDKYPVKDLYRWHMLLTASCYRGRKQLLTNLGVDLEKDMATVPEFFEAVKGKHGTEVIEMVEKIMLEMQTRENAGKTDEPTEE